MNPQLGTPPAPTGAAQPVTPAASDNGAARTVADNLGSYLERRWNDWKTARLPKENDWLEDLRAYNGIYEADIQQVINAGRAEGYVNITRMKTQAAFARIVDLLFQSSDNNWSIEPTPVPEMKDGTTVMDPETHAMIDLTPDQVVDYCATKAKAMSTQIEDQLDEANYDTHAKVAILEACILGSGAIKGPTTKTKTTQRWANQNRSPEKRTLGTVLSSFFKKVSGMAQSAWAMVVEKKVVPDVCAVSIFDLWPDPYATTVEGCTGMIERHVLNSQQFQDLADMPSFDKGAIDDVLTFAPGGNHVDLQHDIALRLIANNNISAGTNERYDVIEYWGIVPGRELIDSGLADIEENKVYQVNVWFCAGRTLKAIMNPVVPERIPYQIFPYKRVPHQFYGQGVPREMHDTQTTINDVVRTLKDNLAYSSGPMGEVNMALLADGENPKDIKGWRIWLRDGGDPQYPMLRFYQIPNITEPLMKTLEIFRRFADEETNLPSYTHGEQTPALNNTASGMSMLMSAANVVLKSTIKNIDDHMTRPTITGYYNWNMKWNSREDIKGDMQVRARGSTVLVAREIQSQRLIQFAQMTANPVDGPLTDRRYLLRSIAESLEINAEKAVPDEQTQVPGSNGGGGNPPPNQPPGMEAPAGVPEPAPGDMPGAAGGNVQPGAVAPGPGQVAGAVAPAGP